MLAKLAVCGCLLVLLLTTSGCGHGGAGEQLVRGRDVVRAFKAHGIVLQNGHVYGDIDAITSAYFAPQPEVSKVTMFVAVCRSYDTARALARRTGSPTATTAAVKRRKNVVVYLATGIDAGTRRGALEALASL